MTSTTKDPILVVIQLTGGNDYLNTVIPYNHGRYRDSRPTVGIPADWALPIDDTYAFNPALPEIKALYDAGKVAVINCVGFPTPNRSHFRSMDIWHTCEPEKLRIPRAGWAGSFATLTPTPRTCSRALTSADGLPRAMALSGVLVASVAVLATYGVLTGIQGEPERGQALDIFARYLLGHGGSGRHHGLPGADRPVTRSRRDDILQGRSRCVHVQR